MAARDTQGIAGGVASEPARSFDGLEDAARYAETHDIGTAGEAANLPPPAGASVTIRLPADLLKRLHREALRRRLDIARAAQAALDEALPTQSTADRQ